mmetsp:Transcript_2722/g.7710  ORF Transcript_2722/g.7710 Transcript_2722/m.7710 type:complete len:200 (-) Transcript_2722:290-889(-)
MRTMLPNDSDQYPASSAAAPCMLSGRMRVITAVESASILANQSLYAGLPNRSSTFRGGMSSTMADSLRSSSCMRSITGLIVQSADSFFPFTASLQAMRKLTYSFKDSESRNCLKRSCDEMVFCGGRKVWPARLAATAGRLGEASTMFGGATLAWPGGVLMTGVSGRPLELMESAAACAHGAACMAPPPPPAAQGAEFGA